MRYTREKNLLSAIEENLARSQQNFEMFLSRHLDMNWAKQKQELFEQFQTHIARSKGEDISGASQTGNEAISQNSFSLQHYFNRFRSTRQSVYREIRFADVIRTENTPSRDSPSTVVYSKQHQYFEIIKQLNDARTSSKYYNCLNVFAQTTSNFGSDAVGHVVETSIDI